jgi:hypothetical protein
MGRKVAEATNASRMRRTRGESLWFFAAAWAWDDAGFPAALGRVPVDDFTAGLLVVLLASGFAGA